MSYKVLVVDDDKTILKMQYKAMKAAGIIDSDYTTDPDTALKFIDEKQYDLLMLDVGLPRIDGFEIIKQIRGRGINMPIMIISGRKSEADILYGLEIGADEYVTKPFNPVTVVAKAKALMRRYRGEATAVVNSMVKVGPFSYNAANLKFYKNDVEIPMSSKENAIIKLFMDNVDKTFSKEIIYETVWGDEPIDKNKVMVYINRIRSKIEDDPSRPKYLITIRNEGYKFKV